VSSIAVLSSVVSNTLIGLPSLSTSVTTAISPPVKVAVTSAVVQSAAKIRYKASVKLEASIVTVGSCASVMWVLNV